MVDVDEVVAGRSQIVDSRSKQYGSGGSFQCFSSSGSGLRATPTATMELV